VLYPSIYQARAVSVSTTALTVLVPQVFGDVPINVTDFIGTPDRGMGWIFFQAGKADFPVWLGEVGAAGGGGDTATHSYAANVSGSAVYVLTHNLNTRDVQAQVYRVTSPYDTVTCEIERTTVNTVTVRFGSVPVGTYRVVVIK
jgi:hypothetical protein